MKLFAKKLFVPGVLSLVCVAGGCVTPPSHHSTQEEVAVRTNAGNQAVERLIQKRSYWTYVNLLTRSGVQHYSFADRLHFFLKDEQGRQSALKFLDQRGGKRRITPIWTVYKPLEGTNCWVRIERLFDRGADDPTARTLYVSVFNRQEMIHRRKILTTEYISDYQYDRHLIFESGNHSVTWKTEHDHLVYQVLEDDLNWKSSPPAETNTKQEKK